MLLLPPVTLLLLWATEDAGGWSAVIKARLREPLTVDCTFNCSSGFVHGSWTWNKSDCVTCAWELHSSVMSNDMCKVMLFTPNLTAEQTLLTYTCFSIMSDHQDLPRKVERQVSLQIEDKNTAPGNLHEVRLALTMRVEVYRNQENSSVEMLSSGPVRVPVGIQLKLKCLSDDEHCEGQWMWDTGILPNANTGSLLQWGEITQEDGGRYTCHAKQLCASQDITVIIEVTKDDDSGWVSILTAFGLSAVIMLMVTLMFLCYKKQLRLKESEVSSTVIYANTRTKSEASALRPPAQDSQDSAEVPYADIVISVRGSSTPELTGVQRQAPGDPRLRWRDDPSAGVRLQACRSADRLHVHPKEVARKLSTTSEYAVITYSTEVLS